MARPTLTAQVVIPSSSPASVRSSVGQYPNSCMDIIALMNFVRHTMVIRCIFFLRAFTCYFILFGQEKSNSVLENGCMNDNVA
ncbi:hypothetical protein WN943_020512 [Citrus x changshan-huyou]